MVSNPVFDVLIIIAIIINSILLSMSDYNHVTDSNELSEVRSPINAIIIKSEFVFTAIFTVELVLKVLAFGLIANDLPDKKPYLKDSWNWLDLAVVLFALLANVNVLSSQITKVFRLFRVLRPLKTVKSLPTVAAIVTGMLNSMNNLSEILFTISFVFIFFSIIGMTIFGGPFLHTRCRLTPYPVNTSWVATFSEGYLNGSLSYPYTMDYSKHRCVNAPNFDSFASASWQVVQSPWSLPRPYCYWPVDNSNPQVCSVEDTGTGKCSGWCGSNYDSVGNPRFDAATAALDTYTEYLGYGFVHFDNFLYALLFVIQVFSGDSWSPLMYKLTNCFNLSAGVIYCTLIVLFGTFFLLQLNIALMQKSFLQEKVSKSKKNNKKKKKRREQIARSGSFKTATAYRIERAASCRVHPMREKDGEGHPSVPGALKDDESISGSSFRSHNQKSFQLIKAISELPALWHEEMKLGIASSLEKHIRLIDRPQHNAFRRFCKSVYTNRVFEYLTMIVIVSNTALFAYTHYGMDRAVFAYITAAQYVITLYSFVETFIALAGLGLIEYFSNSYNTFDFAVVVLSAVGTFSANASLQPVLSLRSFRCFTIFRLLRLSYFNVSSQVVNVYQLRMYVCMCTHYLLPQSLACIRRMSFAAFRMLLDRCRAFWSFCFCSCFSSRWLGCSSLRIASASTRRALRSQRFVLPSGPMRQTNLAAHSITSRWHF